MPQALATRRAPPVEIADVARAARPHMLELCRRWLPGGRLHGAEWTCGSLAGEAGASCKVNVRTGRWADFATGQAGGDAVSLAAAVHRLSQREAAERLAGMLGAGGHG
jgi:putative DNA primase/helicase